MAQGTISNLKSQISKNRRGSSADFIASTGPGSIHLAFGQQLLIGLPRALVVLLRLLHFVGLDKLLFLRPTLVNALEAPFGAALGRADRLVADKHENRVRVR